MDFERLCASSPVNATAARQMGKGEAWSPRKRHPGIYDDMPEIADIPKNVLMSQGFVDYRTFKFDRMHVVGLLAGKSKKQPAAWVCRCKCGTYYTRLSKKLRAIVESGSMDDRCEICWRVDSMRKGERYCGVKK